MVGKSLRTSLPLGLGRFVNIEQALGHANIMCINPLDPTRRKPTVAYPHFDSLEPGVAMVWYLSGGARDSGTGFYRYRHSGKEALTSVEQFKEYHAAIPDDLPGTNQLFEQLGLVKFVPNRVVAFSRNVFHAGVAGADELPCNALTGRLTISLFFGSKMRSSVPLLDKI